MSASYWPVWRIPVEIRSPPAWRKRLGTQINDPAAFYNILKPVDYLNYQR